MYFFVYCIDANVCGATLFMSLSSPSSANVARTAAHVDADAVHRRARRRKRPNSMHHRHSVLVEPSRAVARRRVARHGVLHGIHRFRHRLDRVCAALRPACRQRGALTSRGDVRAAHVPGATPCARRGDVQEWVGGVEHVVSHSSPPSGRAEGLERAIRGDVSAHSFRVAAVFDCEVLRVVAARCGVGTRASRRRADVPRRI